MKLSEIKIALIDQFFAVNCNGIVGEALNKIIATLSKDINVPLSEQQVNVICAGANTSNEPSKAFKRFTEGDSSLLTISDSNGTLYAAVRDGKTIKVANLTTDPISEELSGFATVKQALKQAKLIDEDIIFSITTDFKKVA
jgi:6-phosphogluconolactonase (cycloisomerase 2 family)